MKTAPIISAAGQKALFLSLFIASLLCHAAPVDVAPFGLPLPEANGIQWEDPREIHEVLVHFKETPPSDLRLEYWGSRWPEQHLPKDREPGGGDVGWMELGNWHNYGWRTADAATSRDGNQVKFTFRPVNAKEFPAVKDYPATFRYTLKIRVQSASALPRIEKMEVRTDSVWTQSAARIVWRKKTAEKPQYDAFNGWIDAVEAESDNAQKLTIRTASNPDPNSFDRTLVTVRMDKTVFTFSVDDLARGPLYMPQWDAAVLAATDSRDFESLAAEYKKREGQSLYDRIFTLPERTWKSAWADMPAKKSDIYYPLGLDGGRQRFRLDANGSISFRSNDHYLRGRPGKDTPRLDWEKAPMNLEFDLPGKPAFRTLSEDTLPLCETTWEKDGVRIKQVAFASPLEGASDSTPGGDSLTVLMAGFSFTNTTSRTLEASLSFRTKSGDAPLSGLSLDAKGILWNGRRIRAQIISETPAVLNANRVSWQTSLPPGKTASLIIKIPYVLVESGAEQAALEKLDFQNERMAAANYWRKRMDASASLITPEPMLNDFYRALASHLLVNCEFEPGNLRRFARVGSFGYGAYGNESCMMVEDLERRGYHREAAECLEAWLHYQGTVELPGSFASKEGVLYGAGGYEAGGYNQHHGWILWSLAQHYRYTRDDAWLKHAAPGMVKAADWIIRETKRTESRHPLEQGLLPAGSLEDIGDWWTWLSTSCYTWRGLDSAGWALGQMGHPDATRVQSAANAYKTALLSNFRTAASRSPVIRLGDGTAVPHFPSYTHRRGRSFGWICETLEGALHLLITGVLDSRSEEAKWILKDYEDNLYLSNQYGYLLDDFDKYWFSRGGMSMQACLLLDVEPYLFRDDVPHALRALFNGLAVSYFPDVRMNTEHALPAMGDWRGDHFKSSDESNAAGWLRYLFVREENDRLLIGQAIPRDWLQAGKRCGMQRTSTWFGTTSVIYEGGNNTISAQLDAPHRNPPQSIRVRFRDPLSRPIRSALVNGKPCSQIDKDWIDLPGNIGKASIEVRF